MLYNPSRNIETVRQLNSARDNLVTACLRIMTENCDLLRVHSHLKMLKWEKQRGAMAVLVCHQVNYKPYVESLLLGELLAVYNTSRLYQRTPNGGGGEKQLTRNLHDPHNCTTSYKHVNA